MKEYLFLIRGSESPLMVRAPDLAWAVSLAKKQLGSHFREVVQIVDAAWREDRIRSCYKEF